MADRPGAWITFRIDTRTSDRAPSAGQPQDSFARVGAAKALPRKAPLRLNFTMLQNKPVAAAQQGLNKLMVCGWGERLLRGLAGLREHAGLGRGARSRLHACVAGWVHIRLRI